MAGNTFVYIDGESHYIRSEHAWRKIHGDAATLDRIRYADEPAGKLVLVDAQAKVFWTRKMNPGADRSYYFTSAAGDDQALHAVKVALRTFGLEPHVIHEKSQLAKRRQHTLETQRLIEKPKGVDIALAVQMLEDSHWAFEVCHLYTSDADFLPVVKALRARGKQVFVHGYPDGLGAQSEFLHACDQFTDLEVALRDQFELAPST